MGSDHRSGPIWHAWPMPLAVYGLTGGIASGKSAAADEFARLGAVVIDADELARAVVASGTPGLRSVVAAFGEGILTDGELDRAALGEIIFESPEHRLKLNSIVHPLVRAEAARLTAAADPEAIVIQMIPLLVETNAQGRFDKVIVVDASEQTQIERLMARNGLNQEQAAARLAAQATRAQRRSAADWVIDNSGSIEDLAQQVREVWEQISPLAERVETVGPDA